MIAPLCLLSLAAIPLSTSRVALTAGSSEAQNVVVILADDVGVDMVGAYERFYDGHPQTAGLNTTPAIDYLADTGLTFRNAWTNPVCSPSRAQILTGKQGLRSGIGKVVSTHIEPFVQLGMGLTYAQDTIPSLLRTSSIFDYHTAAVGKWHLAHPHQHTAPISGQLHPLGDTTNPWFHQYAGSLHNLQFEGGAGYNDWLKTYATEIDPANDECTPTLPSGCRTVTDHYATVDTAEDAIHLIKSMPEPFFLYVAFNAAHLPLDGPSITPILAPSCSGLGGEVLGNPNCSLLPESAENSPHNARCLVQWMDNEIGRLICAIESDAERPDQPTTIIFLGDNGTNGPSTLPPFDKDHGKGTQFDGGINVPFIVKSPCVSPALVGQSTHALVGSTDLFATIAELAEASLPSDPYEQRDSVSILPILTGASSSVRDYVYAENFKKNFVPTPEGAPPQGYYLLSHTRSIRDLAGFKLIQTVNQAANGVVIDEQLFNVRSDPFETSDRYADAVAVPPIEPYASHYASLRAELDTRYPALVH